MVDKKKLIGLLPKFKNEKRLILHRQDTDDIIEEILITHDEYKSDYDKICKFFDFYDQQTTGREIFDFCKKNLPYTIESERMQTVKSPACILTPGQEIDCKHYSLFIGGILDSIKRNKDNSLNWCYRFASYSNDKNIEHVFVVMKQGNREIWIDPVLNFYNEKRLPTYYIDENPNMALYKLSGIGNSTAVTVASTDEANADFLTWLTYNLFSMKDLLRSNMKIVNTDVKKFYEDNNLDFQQLLNFLNA